MIIISNQKGITGANGKARKEDITGKLTDIVAQLGIPVQCFVATAGARARAHTHTHTHTHTPQTDRQADKHTVRYTGTNTYS